MSTTAPATARDSSTPVWGWAFVIACVAIPVVSLGGAIPGAIGGAGAFACYRAARQPGTSTTTRLAICTAIAIGCWTVFIALLAVLGTVR